MVEIELDKELKRGTVTLDALEQLYEAEVYGTATPMRWLEKRLKILENLLDAGNTVVIEKGNLTIQSTGEFHEWCKNNLPDAYECFFQERTNTK